MITKFRAWDKVAEDIFIPEVLELDKYGKVTGIFSKGTMFSIEDFELLKSTGLFDKNGKEIYEGDILHHKVQGTGVVFYPYRDTMASFGIRNVNTNFGRNLQDTAKAGYEVIGNKFKHPHLLGEE
ncbi:YopX family protein [Mammaliicoccus sciuri]